MRPGDALGDYCQRAIVLALIFEPVRANENSVGVSTPLTQQCRSGLRHNTEVGGRSGFLELPGQSLQAASQCRAPSAMGSLLQLLGEGADQQIATEA